MKKVLIPALLFAFTCTLYAQRQPGTLELAAIGFARDSGKVQVELYYSVLQSTLHFEEKGGKWIAPIQAKLQIFQDDKLIAEKNVQKQVIVSGTKEDIQRSTNVSLDALFFTVPYNRNTKATLTFTGEDEKGKSMTDVIERNIYMPSFKKDSFTFSGIELASAIAPTDDKANLFEKVGYIVTPNPSRIYGSDFNLLCYYTELYIPPAKVSSTDSVEITTRILDANQNQITKVSKMAPLTTEIVPLLSSIDIDGMPTDTYFLDIKAQYQGSTVAWIQKTFHYENSMKISEEEVSPEQIKSLDEDVLFQTSDISKMADLELNEKVEQTGYIMKDEVRNSFKKLTSSDEKKKAFFHFWRMQDAPDGNPLQSYREYFSRVASANKKFTYQKTVGWKSDRGRVWITYGPPVFVEDAQFNAEAKPYLIWEYSSLKMRLTAGSKAQFVFLDRLGGGNYTLVHSNVQGEVQESDWYSREAMRLR